MNANYTQRMGKLGGLALIAVIALAGCTSADGSASAAAKPTMEARPAAVYTTLGGNEVQIESADLEKFVTEVQASESTYSKGKVETIRGMAKEACEHYADGFTTEDLRRLDGERLAIVGEIALQTVCH